MAVRSFGGIYDCRAGRWHDESAQPTTWFLSEEQARLAIHGDDLPDQVLVRAAEGAGKTRGVVAPWGALRVIEFAGGSVELGGVAPTQRRLETLRIALTERMPAHWYIWRQRDSLFRFHCGPALRLVSAHRASEAEGSPVQGYDWVAWLGDEVQDMIHVVDDVQARGRRAPGGRYRGVGSCSAKDTSAYRDFVAKWLSAPRLRGVEKLAAFANPGVAKSHWENLRQTLDDRSYRRRVLAEDVGPENAVYPAWERKENVRPVPLIGARDVTARELKGFHALIGHDPGALYDVSLVLKAYEVGGRVCWWVVDELTTKQTTTDEHAAALRDRLQQVWQLQWPGHDEPKVLIRCDPYGDSDAKTDRSVYTTFKLAGFSIMSAAYNKQGEGRGRVPKDAAIDMVNGLLCSRAKVRRLFVAADDRGATAAPGLVKAIEESRRDEGGKAEVYRKGTEQDLSHWPAALRYALWPYERTREPPPSGLREAFF